MAPIDVHLYKDDLAAAGDPEQFSSGRGSVRSHI
jgi:hypothetical protein